MQYGLHNILIQAGTAGRAKKTSFFETNCMPIFSPTRMLYESTFLRRWRCMTELTVAELAPKCGMQIPGRVCDIDRIKLGGSIFSCYTDQPYLFIRV